MKNYSNYVDWLFKRIWCYLLIFTRHSIFDEKKYSFKNLKLTKSTTVRVGPEAVKLKEIQYLIINIQNFLFKLNLLFLKTPEKKFSWK